MSAHTHLQLIGKDAAKFMHNLCTNDVVGRDYGSLFEAFLCDVKGRTLSFGVAYLLEAGEKVQRVNYRTVAGQGESLLAHFDRYLFRDDVELSDLSDSTESFVIAGAESANFLAQLGFDLSGLDRDYRATEQKVTGLTIDGSTVDVLRYPLLDAHCYLVVGSTPFVNEIAKRCEALGLEMLPESDIETMRIEMGWPQFGVDIEEKNLPQEVDRNDRAIHFRKGCYLGQETVARLDALGQVQKKLVGLRFSGTSVPAAGTLLMDGEKEAGKVTSATWSTRQQSVIALGYVKRGSFALGFQLQSEAGNCEVIALPAMKV